MYFMIYIVSLCVGWTTPREPRTTAARGLAWAWINSLRAGAVAGLIFLSAGRLRAPAWNVVRLGVARIVDKNNGTQWMSLYKLRLNYLLPVYFVWILNYYLYIIGLLCCLIILYHLNIVIKTSVYIITVSIIMPLWMWWRVPTSMFALNPTQTLNCDEQCVAPSSITWQQCDFNPSYDNDHVYGNDKWGVQYWVACIGYIHLHLHKQIRCKYE